MKQDSVTNYLNQRLQDQKFKQAWETSEPQYQITRALIQERIIQKMSQRELARKANTTQAVISRTESLAVNPSIGLLQKIASALGKRLVIGLE